MNANPQHPPRIVLSKLVLGLCLIAAGSLYSLDRLGYIDARNLLDYWSLILVALGLAKIVQPGASSSRFSGMLLIVIGVIILGENLRHFDVELEDLLPLVLVLLGLRIAWHALRPRGPAAIDSPDATGRLNATSILGGASRANNSQDFRGGDLIAIMGGHQIDLRGAKISHGPAVLDIFAFWGGMEIRVPEDWQVDLQGLPVLGTFEDSTRLAKGLEAGPETQSNGGVQLAKEPSARQVLIVKGLAVMGGVEIKN